MKKKFEKKLTLNKKTISNLEHKEMEDIRGGSIIFVCSDSCSIIFVCCDSQRDAMAKATC
jgi:natural product precursor